MAVVQRVQEPGFADPPFLFHELRVHNGDLAGGTAEADATKLDPETKRFLEGDRRGCFGFHVLSLGIVPVQGIEDG